MTEPTPAGVPAPDDLTQVRAQLAIEAAGIGTFDWDLVSGVLDWDDRLIALFGYDAATFDRSIEGFNTRLHPDDLPRVGRLLQSAIDTVGDYEAEYRIVLPTGELRSIAARGRALAGPAGAAARLIGVAYDVTGDRQEQARIGRIVDAMPASFFSLDRQWRFTHVNPEAERTLRQDADQLLGRTLWAAFPAMAGTEFERQYRTALRTGQPVAFEAQGPAAAQTWFEVRAWPTSDGLSVWFIDVTDRHNAQERVERAGRRVALLAQVSAELAGTLDTRAATARLPRLVVPALADFCILTAIAPDGQPRDVGSWHVEPASRAVLERYVQVRLDAMPVTSPVARALTGGEPLTFSGSEVRDLLQPGPARQLLEVLAPESEVALPLRARGRTLGLLTLFYARGHSPTDEDVAVAQDVADRAGLALDNARLYGEQQQLAEGLQRSLLTAPPEPDHAEVVVRYLPAVEAARVGGDWYDAFLQPDGTTMLVIGDVVGHDIEAAAAMGQLRSLLRGIAIYSNGGPAEVLRGVDTTMEVLGLGTLATASVARFEQTEAEIARGVTRMVWANAGHLPPLAVDPDGAVTVLADWKADLLLGVDPTTHRTESTVTLARGSTVLLYTDGLIERRDSDLDAGLARLRDALAEFVGLPLQELCDRLLERLVDGRPDDDVALVAVRLHPQDRPRPAEAGPNRVPRAVPADPATDDGAHPAAVTGPGR